MENSNTSQILVVGATGFLGMEICRQLTAAHKNVTGLVRKTSSEEKVKALKQLGVHTVEGDLKDRNSIKKALSGIFRVISTASSTISMQPGDSIQTVDHQGQSDLIDEAVAAGVKQYIFVSVAPGTPDCPLISVKHKVEKKLIATSMNYTILQPTFFTEVWLSPHIGFDFPNSKATIYGDGKNKISWIAIKDVAAFAVAALDSPIAKNKAIPLGGPEALSPLEVVALFEKAGNRKFELQHVPVGALEAQRNAAPDDLGKSFSTLMLSYAAGDEIDMKETLKLYPMKLRSVKEYAEQMSKVSQPA
jgi:uncharacterized protein YbjT (DUF2867 family)